MSSSHLIPILIVSNTSRNLSSRKNSPLSFHPTIPISKMTKNKVTRLSQNPNIDHNHHQKKRETPSAVSKPDMDQDLNEKLQNLKCLNALLIKETMEKRQQVESLGKAKEALETELARSHQERKGLKAELVQKGFENLILELEKSVFSVIMETQMKDMCNGVEDLGRICVELGKVKDEKVLECSDLRKRFDDLTGVVERECVVLSDLRREKDLLKSECDSWVAKANDLKESLNETENARKNLETRFENLKKEYEKLVGEKEDGERSVQAVVKERDGVRDSLVQALEEIDELKRKVDELVREKRDIESEKTEMETKISTLEEEMGVLNEVVTGLRKEEGGLSDKVVRLEKRCEDATLEFEEEVGGLRGAMSALESSGQKQINENKDLLDEISSYRDTLDPVTHERDNGMNGEKVQDMKRHEYLQDSDIKAKKKKRFWILLSAGTLFATVAVAYLAKGR